MGTVVGRDTEPAVDGRQARRERGRLAVIDAMFELTGEGRLPPPVDEIAARSGVSVSSVFRYFENLDDLQQEMIDRYFERFDPLFEVPSLGVGPLEERIARFVDTRLTLFDAVAGPARMARIRAREQSNIGASLALTRARFAQQVRDHFAPETSALTPARRDDLVSMVDVLASFESWELMQEVHGRSRRQIRRAWRIAIERVWAEEPTTVTTGPEQGSRR